MVKDMSLDGRGSAQALILRSELALIEDPAQFDIASLVCTSFCSLITWCPSTVPGTRCPPISSHVLLPHGVGSLYAARCRHIDHFL